MSFVVESVSASEASEVLKARLTVIKNNLKAAESKVQTAKVDVGVAAGVGVGADATKTAIKDGLESQTRLVAKNSNLRKNPTPCQPQAEPKPQAAPQAPVSQASDVTKDVSKQTQSSAPQAPAPQAPAPQAPAPQTPAPQSSSQADIKKAQHEAVVNITAVIDEYVGQLEEQVAAQIEAIQQAIATVRQAEKERQIDNAARLLAKIQALDEAFTKAAENDAKYQAKQKERLEQNKQIVIQFIADTKKQAAEAKAKTKAEIEQIIETIKPHLEQAEALYREKKENATVQLFDALNSIQKAINAVKEYQYHKLKTELQLRYPLTMARLANFADKAQKVYNEIKNATQPIQSNAQAQVKTQSNAQTQQKPIVALEKGASFLQKQRSVVSVVNEKEQHSNPAVLVALNTNKLKQKLSQLH